MSTSGAASDTARIKLKTVRGLNIFLTALGMAVFGVLLAIVAFDPDGFERRTTEIALAEVERRVPDRVAGAVAGHGADRLADYAARISPTIETRLSRLRNQLNAGIDDLVADILASACKLDCERREAARAAVQSYYEAEIARHGIALDRLRAIVIGEYEAVVAELRTDMLIFLGSNLFAMSLAFGLAVFRRRAARHLLPISVALTGATLIATLWYLIGQDWLATVIFGDYWGWGYALALAALSALMIDIGVNRARVTSRLLNLVGGALPPC